MRSALGFEKSPWDYDAESNPDPITRACHQEVQDWIGKCLILETPHGLQELLFHTGDDDAVPRAAVKSLISALWVVGGFYLTLQDIILNLELDRDSVVRRVSERSTVCFFLNHN